MYFDPLKVISDEELQHIFYSSLGYQNDVKTKSENDIVTSESNQTEIEEIDETSTIFRSIEIGETTYLSSPEALKTFMSLWVERMDSFINLLKQEHHPHYKALHKQLLFERGFSFKEYCNLFDVQLSESEYHHYPAYTFLGIHTEALRRHFTANRSAHVSHYSELLAKVHLRIWSFFLKKLSTFVPYNELLKHCYITGKSGSGKSELMKTMFYSIQKNSQRKRNTSLLLIDPHGDLAEEVRNFHLNNEHDRLVYLDAYLESGYTPTINPLELPTDAKGNVLNDKDTINIISEELVKVFQELLRDASLSNQMKALVMPCIATLLRKGDSSLIDLQKFMDDDNNSELVKWGMKSPNPSHRNFFATQFYNGGYKRTKSSLFTKIQSLLNSHTFYNLVTGKSTVNLEQSMNQGKVIVFNLSKGRMGVEASEAFGRFVIATVQTIAQRRANIPAKKRKPSFIFIDEFQNYITDSIQIILKEARKYRVPLILANQTIEDIRSPEMLSNILNNTEVKLIGRNGIKTLKELAKEIGVKVEVLQKMKKYHFNVKAGDRTPHEFKTTAFLKGRGFQLTAEELKALISFQLKKYYKPIETYTAEPNEREKADLSSGLLEKIGRIKEEGGTAKDTNDVPPSKSSPKPKFEL